MKHRNTLTVYIMSIVAATGGLLFGFDTGVVSGAIPFLQKDFGITDSGVELITTAGLLGAIIGALFGGKFTDRLGRRKILLASGLIFAVGALWSGLASSPASLTAARLFLGLAIGTSSFAVPLYLAEISPMGIRGTLVSMFQLMITIGILVAYFSDYAFADESNVASWRPMFYVGVLPALILFCGMMLMPESPRWLFSQGRDREAMGVLRRTEGGDAERVASSLRADIERDAQNFSRWSDLFKTTWKWAACARRWSTIHRSASQF
ncbi:MAG: MFS transporter [Bacteroidaceae bacterium]|nr:MFS transporter [Bacteroidaceae bacterium]